MPSPLHRSPGSAASPCSASFVWTPTDLILKYRHRPEVPAIYAALVRLCELAKGPIEVSRADLARWCGAEREDATGVAIERAIWSLRNDGWLIISEGEGRKRRLLVAWGFGQDGRPRPWRFDRRDRGRPAAVQVVAVPLTLFDGYLGRLRLDPHGPAEVDRYFDRPLLGFDDIGVYATRQVGNVPATPRLSRLGLLDDQGVVTPPTIDELLALAAAGRLSTCATDGTIIPVKLSPAGEARLRKRRTATPRPTSDAQDGSTPDPERSFDGSANGSVDSESHLASQCDTPQVFHSGSAAWDTDGKNKLTKSESPPALSRARARTAEGGSSTPRYSELGRDQPDRGAPPQQPGKTAAASEKNHTSMLDPLILLGHQALNPERDIPSPEWFGLLVLQQEHGRDALLTWQKRAAGAGRTEILLAYYDACAADAAFGTMRGREPRPDRREPAQDPPSVVPKTAPAPRYRAPEPRRASEPPAAPMRGSRARDLLLDGIERLLGRAIRYREKLAGVPLALLAKWREIAAHPGLRRLDDPIAYLVALAADGKNPPALDELNAWAQQAGVHWADPSLSASLCDVDEWDEGDALADAGSDSVPNCIDSATEMISSVLDPRGSLWDNLLRSEAVPTDLTFALREALAEMLPQRCWPLLERLAVRIADGVTYIVAARSLHDIMWDMQGVIRDALLDLDLPDMGQIIAPADAQPTEPVAELPRPGWIGAEVWHDLPAVARAALVRSKLGTDGIVGGNLRALERCFPGLLPRLMASAQLGPSP